MLCIKRENCDFNGVITQKTLNLTPGMVTQTINFQFAGLPGLRVMMYELLEGTEENFVLKWGKSIYLLTYMGVYGLWFVQVFAETKA